MESQSLNKLYNSKVDSAQRYERPLDIKGPQLVKDTLPKHCGVVVTLENDQRYLVHKGNGFGKESQTVVVDTKHMSSAWTAKESKVDGSSTVGDYVKAGGPNYNVLTDNCKGACKKMMKLP